MTNSVGNSKTHLFTTNLLSDIYLGSASGISAVALIKPQMYFKNVSQTPSLNAKFTINPLILYRGTGVFAASFVPIVAIQSVVNGLLSPNSSNPLSPAIAAGVSSSIIVSPSECILRQQEITGKNLKETISNMYSQRGLRIFCRGLIPTAIREGAFAGSYLGAVPELREKIKFFGFSDTQAQVSAGIISGTIAAVISQPFDTYKTQVQSDLSKKISLRSVFQKDAFLGLSWRISMMATATTIMPAVKERLSN